MSRTIPLSQIPTITLLYQLGRLQPASTNTLIPLPTPHEALNDMIGLIRADITKLEVDSIVNAANKSLLGGGGVDAAIHRGAGPGLVRECQTLGGCSTGSAKITDAYNLPCRRVIHAVGPVYSYAKKTGSHERLLRGCYRRSLELAEENDCKSIAFSALSTGVYGYPSEEAAETAIDEVKRFLLEPRNGSGVKLERVVFCSFEEKDEKAYEKWIPYVLISVPHTCGPSCVVSEFFFHHRKFFPPAEHQPAKAAAGDKEGQEGHGDAAAAVVAGKDEQDKQGNKSTLVAARATTGDDGQDQHASAAVTSNPLESAPIQEPVRVDENEPQAKKAKLITTDGSTNKETDDEDDWDLIEDVKNSPAKATRIDDDREEDVEQAPPKETKGGGRGGNEEHINA